mmetsp:Transcript_7272/g.22504  ORF Transcript_7272/g.22504 Transcript_7272/m.22504 type:complete len:96 (-) Transcript_7272:635-922(-)|eukprot:scaffold43095_cov27-Tisochrysis_lutea.AAC.2
MAAQVSSFGWLLPVLPPVRLALCLPGFNRVLPAHHLLGVAPMLAFDPVRGVLATAIQNPPIALLILLVVGICARAGATTCALTCVMVIRAVCGAP